MGVINHFITTYPIYGGVFLGIVVPLHGVFFSIFTDSNSIELLVLVTKLIRGYFHQTYLMNDKCSQDNPVKA